MAEKLDLGFPRTVNVKEQLARTTLNIVRMQGHPYVELREEGKRFIFYCTLCRSPCFSDAVLMNHLSGSLHKDRLSAAKLTLLKPNPWPFNDGFLFFNTSVEDEKEKQSVGITDKSKLDAHSSDIEYDGSKTYDCDLVGGCGKEATESGGVHELLIPGVLIKDDIAVLKVKLIGYGLLGARLCENNGSDSVSKIWCQWLGKTDQDGENMTEASEHEFSIVTFPYNYDLGRERLVNDLKLLPSPGSAAELENGNGITRKRKTSFSDTEDVSELLSNHYESSSEDSSSLNGGFSKLLLDRYDDHLLHTCSISSKRLRRELRRKQRLAAERMCGICLQKMLLEKDVASLINLKTGKLACASRNENGAFHIFHTSCLIHWVLLCESEMIRNPSVSLKARKRSQKKSKGKCKKTRKKGKAKDDIQIHSVFCPECQGTGVTTGEGERELPTVPLSEIFKHKIRVGDGHKAWMRSPEILENCSTGLYFSSPSEATAEEKVSTLKLLRFYRAGE